MGKEKFKKGLIDMGFEIEDPGDSWLVIKSYKIETGRFGGKIVDIAFDVPSDFEIAAPHGPHIRPLLFPINSGSKDPKERMHKSSLGKEWGHLSRPFPKWESEKRTVERYMSYIKYLLEKTL